MSCHKKYLPSNHMTKQHENFVTKLREYHKIVHFACVREIFMCFEIIFIEQISSYSNSQKFRNHWYSTVFESTNFS